MTPKYMQEIDNRLPIEGKNSYLTKIRSYWIVMNPIGNPIYQASRRNWAIKYIRNHWDELE